MFNRRTRKWLGLFLAAACVLTAVPLPGSAGIAKAAQDYGIGTGKPTTASKDSQGNTASYANDGDDATRWYDGDNTNDGNWLLIDLEEVKEIRKVRLNWGSDTGTYPKAYRIQASADGTDGSYTDLYVSEQAPAQAVEEFEVNGTGRYIKLLIDSHGQWGTSVYELNLWDEEPEATADPYMIKYEAEGGRLSDASQIELEHASGGRAVGPLQTPGGNVAFSHIPAAGKIAVSYTSEGDGRIGLYINGTRTDIELPASDTFREKVFQAQIPENAQIRVQYDEGDQPITLDYIRVTGRETGLSQTGNYEAEDAVLIQGDNYEPQATEVKAVDLANASGGKYVDGFQESGDGSGICYPQMIEKDGVYVLKLGYARYYYEKADTISVYVNGVKRHHLNLVSQGSNVDDTIISDPFELELKAGDTISIQVDAADNDQGMLRIDYLNVTEKSDEPDEPDTVVNGKQNFMIMPQDKITVPVEHLPDGEVLSYESDHQEIAAVDALTGEITGISAGTARIRGTGTADPGFEVVYQVKVVDEESELVPETMTMEAEEGTLLQGENTAKQVFVRSDAKASQEKSVDGFYDSGNGAGVLFKPAIPSEDQYDISVCYARDSYLIQTDTMSVFVNGERKGAITLLPHTGYSDYQESDALTLNLKPDDEVSIQVSKKDQDAGLLRLDYIRLTKKVTIPARGIELPESLTINEKESLDIPVTLTPEAADAKDIRWASSGEEMVSVDQGTIRANGTGDAVVTAVSVYNPSITDSVQIHAVQNENLDTLTNDTMTVMIDKTFPRVIEYRMASGAVMGGNSKALTQIKLNGKLYTPQVRYVKEGAGAEYKLTVPELEATITMTVRLEDNILKLDVTGIEESEDKAKRIFTFEIPDLNIISVGSNEAGAAFAGSKVESDITKTGDRFLDLTKTNSTDVTPDEYAYGFLNNEKVAAGIRSNGMDTKVYKQTVQDGSGYRTGLWNGTWRYRADDYTKKFQDMRGDYGAAGEVVTKTYEADYTEQLPLLYVVLAEDVNDSGNVDWQDAAVEFRKIMPTAQGMEEIPDAVVQRLVFPQSGEGNYPYVASLDETKRVYLNTDGLGQLVLNKFHNTGVWGDFTVYDDRLGGLRDFNKYVSDATNLYNSWVGVHTNYTEIFAKAGEFRPESILMQDDGITPKNGGYQAYGYWLEQVYTPDITFEALSLERQNRLVGFKNEVPDLGFIYSDVFSGGGWKGRRLAEDYKAAGLSYFVEWPYQNEEEAVWSHWAVEKVYSPPNLKAYASDIARFIFNHTKDRWDNNADVDGRYPNSCNLLMGADTTTYEGWPQKTTNNSFNQAIRVVFDNNLPTKYMQHFPILRMEKDADGWASHIWFEDQVEVYKDESTGKRMIEKDGKVIYNQDSYLIPWDEGLMGNPEGEDKEVKLYHWNEDGGTSTWDLPDSWDGLATVYLYELTDQGKTGKTQVPVQNGKVTLENIKAKTAYVVYKGEAAKEPDVDYGEGGYVQDPGFNYGDLRCWTVDKGEASVKKNDTEFDDPNTPGWGRNAPYGEQRNYELIIDSEEETQVSQKITGLTPGEYAASVMVEVQQGKEREAAVLVDCAGKTSKNYTTKSILLDYDEYDSKIGTYMLRMRTTFTVPEGTNEAVIRLLAEAGEGKVRFDNVRIYDTTTPKAPDDAQGVVLYQDFEIAERDGVTGNDRYKATYEGYYPFNLGGSNGIHETRISIQMRHSPYTDNGADSPWDPNTAKVDDTLDQERSLKVLGTQRGIAIQTTPQTVRFEKGHQYRVSFLYQVQPAADYAFVVGDGKDTGSDASKPANLVSQSILEPTSKTKQFVYQFTADSDQNWIGIYRVQQTYSVSVDPTPLILDNLLVEDLTQAQTDSREALETLYEQNKDRQEDLYTEESWGAFVKALNQAKEALKPEGTKAQIDEAFDALKQAVDGLEPKEEEKPVPVQKDALRELAAEASTWKKEHYTQSSWAVFAAALKRADTILEDAEADQEQVDEAYRILKAACDGLVTVKDISVDVQIKEGMPNIRFGDNNSVLHAVLTDEEFNQLQDGKEIGIILQIQAADTGKYAKDIEAVNAALNGQTLGALLDISLFKSLDGQNVNITETHSPVRLILDVPRELSGNADVERTFSIIRVHNGQAEVLPDLDREDGTITFENSRYSLFAIAYKDEAKKQENNGDPSKNDGNSGGSGHSGGSGKSDGDSQTASVATGDTAPIAGMVILVILAAAAGILVIRRKINRNGQEL